MRSLRLTTKLILAAVLGTLLSTAITLAVTLSTLQDYALQQERERLDSSLKVAWQVVHEQGPEVRLIDGRLYAGTTLLDGNTELVERVQALVGGVAGIFRDTTRVATTAKLADGRRATGTMLEPGPAFDAVVRRHVRYAGLANALGKTYVAVYDPIVSADGQQIGILVVGESLASLDAAWRTTTDRIVLSGLAAVVLVGLATGLLASRMFAPLRGLAAVLGRFAARETAVEVPGVDRGDEIGSMARAVVVFKESLIQLAAQDIQLRRAGLRLQVAVGNISQGLCLYDAAGRLEVANRQFCRIYEIDPAQITPGMTLREVLARSRTLTAGSRDEFEAFVADRERFISRREAASMLAKLGNGQLVSIAHRPLPDDGWVATFEDVTDRLAAEARITYMARHDALTGLPNRLTLNERIQQALTETGRGVRSAVLCLDLDHFKQVNDTLGHPVGDGLLRAVSDRLQACLREGDTVARLGGDEFAIVQVGIARPEDAKLLAERIIAAVAAPFMIDSHHISIGVSIGLCLMAEDGHDAATLLKHADTALYRAKLEERGTFCFFEPEMDARLQRRRQLEVDLRHGLAHDEFELFYQPLIALATQEVSGFEALLRWHHPWRGMVSPAEFIPVAEEIGLIVPLGEWVIRQACADAAAWPPDIKVAVNLSPMQFRSKNLIPTIVAALADAGLPADRLELEVTETLLLQSDERTVAMLHELRALGTRISMDDFGTGYSSLSYLRQFPFDNIKIDQSFVRDLSGQESSIHVVRAIKGMCAGLGMTTTAEGVETEEQFSKLRAEGCTEVQGYLFSKPRPAPEIPAVLEQVRQRRLGLDVAGSELAPLTAGT